VTGDLAGVLISIVFVFAVILASEILRKIGNFGNEFTRKFIHIGVAHWWIVAMYLIDGIWYALIPPALFVAVNYYSYKKDLFKSMERGKDSSDLGTVYFSISLIILILLTWRGGLLGEDIRYIGAIGALVMGYGDGFAAIVGKNYGRFKYHIMNSVKSIEGSAAMFILSFAVTALFLGANRGFGFETIVVSLAVSLLASITEAITPLGMDNITVPIVASVLAYIFTHMLQDRVAYLFIYSAGFGFILSFLISYIAYLKKSLTLDGSIGAIFLGTAMCVTSGLFGSVLMIIFFISSSILSHFKKEMKQEVAYRFDKTGRRDIAQVFANGGVGLIYSVLFYATKNPSFLLMLGAAFAAANADTWATELGILNKKQPICLRTLQRVKKGTSGAVSLIGTFAALLGAMFIGVFTVLICIVSTGFIQHHYNYTHIFILVTAGGFVGSIIDSLLGATIQGVYYSHDIGGETEKSIYNGKPTTLVRGLKFINNDLVNFLSIGISSALLATII
jgi:uncharacterized protein (TIGR00297 family)